MCERILNRIDNILCIPNGYGNSINTITVIMWIGFYRSQTKETDHRIQQELMYSSTWELWSQLGPVKLQILIQRWLNSTGNGIAQQTVTADSNDVKIRRYCSIFHMIFICLCFSYCESLLFTYVTCYVISIDWDDCGYCFYRNNNFNSVLFFFAVLCSSMQIIHLILCCLLSHSYFQMFWCEKADDFFFD